MKKSEQVYPNFKLNGKVAIITGAARGLGRACALALAHEGADIALGLRDVTTAADLEQEIKTMGRNVIRLQMDVSDLQQINDAVARAVETFGKIDILVNNVGVAPGNPAENVTEEDFDHTINLNLKGNFFEFPAIAIMSKRKVFIKSCFPFIRTVFHRERLKNDLIGQLFQALPCQFL